MTQDQTPLDPEERRAIVSAIAQEHLERGDALGWFEALYARAQGALELVPWADFAPHPSLVAYLADHTIPQHARTITVGCGLGDDAETLAATGLSTTAFDISPSAILTCRNRFPDSSVDYQVANLLDLPPEWIGAFDFVYECYTIQALPHHLRSQAIQSVASLLAPAATLLVICRGRHPDEPEGTLPWPLTPDELSLFQTHSLTQTSFQQFHDDETPPVRRFVATFVRKN